MSDSDTTVSETLRWLAYARKDLRSAELLLKAKESFANQICYLSQQAAEKGIKASLVFSRIDFPFTHDLDDLRDLLPGDWHCKQAYTQLKALSEWAVDSRYPGVSEDPSKAQSKEAYSQAKGILESIEKTLVQRGLSLEK